MIYPWLWIWYLTRRFITLLVSVVKPQIEREYMRYRNTPHLKSILTSRFLTGSYQQAINQVVIEKRTLCLILLSSHHFPLFKNILDERRQENEEEEGERGGRWEMDYFVIQVDTYYGWLLACKLQVLSLPTTLIIGPGNVGPRILQRYSHIYLPLEKNPSEEDPSMAESESDDLLLSKESSAPRSILEEQEMAFQRSMQKDLLRQRKTVALQERKERYATLLEKFVLKEEDAGEGRSVYKLAIQMPDGKRFSQRIDGEAPCSILFAIARKELEESECEITIKSVDPPKIFQESEDCGAIEEELMIKDSGLYPLQKLFVEKNN